MGKQEKKETQRSSRPVIWLLLYKGMKPKEIIPLGYSAGTVYKYASMWPTVKKLFKEKWDQHRKS